MAENTIIRLANRFDLANINPLVRSASNCWLIAV